MLCLFSHVCVCMCVYLWSLYLCYRYSNPLAKIYDMINIQNTYDFVVVYVYLITFSVLVSKSILNLSTKRVRIKFGCKPLNDCAFKGI